MSNSRTLGPSVMGTLLCQNGAGVAEAYCQHLYQRIAEQGQISPELATLWGAPALAGNAYWILENSNGEPWLRILEDPTCTAPEPLMQTGWLSLEVSVQDIDSLAAELADSPFKVLRPAADLELSDNIRAAQVAGPAGEILYLTEIKGPVPPFELTPAQCRVDRLFIPVLCCHDREASTEFYEQLASQTGLRFDTKITVINQAYGYDIQRQHPVATIQLNGDCLIEIDQIDDARITTVAQDTLPAGIAMISFETPHTAAGPNIDIAPYNNRVVSCMRGPAGEVIELITTPTSV
ncbi:MAG: hypothetical protein V7746_15570 [Halioglobus sp.]